MGSLFASLAFKAYEMMWSVYDKKYGKKEKSQREISQENLLERQKKIISDAKVYCDRLENRIKMLEGENIELKDRNAQLRLLLKHPRPVPSNPFD